MTRDGEPQPPGNEADGEGRARPSRMYHVWRLLALGFGVLSALLLGFMGTRLVELMNSRRLNDEVALCARNMAVALHREHFRQGPAHLHVLWFHEWRANWGPMPAGLVYPTIPRNPDNPERDAVLFPFVHDYNYVTLGQACYLALHGEHSPRVTAVLKVASRLYAGSTEEDLLDLLDDLERGDETARQEFERVWEWTSCSFGVNRQYFEEEIMPRVDVWRSIGDRDLGKTQRPSTRENSW